jgi:hypothetical protein
MFTADNLPEAAKYTADDWEAWQSSASYGKNFNGFTARALNRLCDSRPGLREWLLNGAAPVEPDYDGDMWPTIKSLAANLLNVIEVLTASRPVATDQPPEVTKEDQEEASRIFWDCPKNTEDSILEALKADRARVWQTHRPKLVDPVRFALEKVTETQWVEFARAIHCSMSAFKSGLTASGSSIAADCRNQLAKILPVAEPVKQWAKLTDEEAFYIARDAFRAFTDVKHIPTGISASATIVRSRLSAYTQPPIKAEVTEEIVKDFLESMDWEYQKGSTLARMIASALTSSFDLANTQAEARESEAVAEGARLTNDARAYETGLLAERDRVERLQKHADALEALLMADGVKTWEPFEVQFGKGNPFVPGELRLGFFAPGVGYIALGEYTKVRQTPAPELKRYRVEMFVKGGGGFTTEVTTGPVTRQQAELMGKVLGEAE